LSAFAFLAQPGREEQYAAFQTIMTLFQDASWMNELRDLDDAATTVTTAADKDSENHNIPGFVDVGGGHGHQCVQLMKKYPALKGRVVLEDLPEAVGAFAPVDGLVDQSQSFFQEQKIVGSFAFFFSLSR
jgi:demethylsterigmatocystin 6-O-methyltransferase